MVRISTLSSALEAIASEEVSDAAGKGGVLSRTEQKALDPFLSDVADTLRAEQKGARLTPEKLASRAVIEAQKTWAAHNQESGPGRSILSSAERKAVAKASPALGALTQLAALRAAQGQGGAAAAQAVRDFFSSYDFAADPISGMKPLHAGLPGATKIDARAIFPGNRADLPSGVLASFDFYDRAMEADWATATLQRAKIAGHEVYVVYATTDGDDGYLEILDKQGAPLASARLYAEQLVGWDEVFGRARFGTRMVALDEPKAEEGLSEPAERAAAGQVPQGWPGAISLSQGTLGYDGYQQLTTIDVPGLASSPHRELGVAAFQYLWEASLRHRVIGSTEPFELGALKEGTMTLGTFTRTDGKSYEVAKWNDIDDGSFTLYFDRAPGGRLRLAVVEFDN